jgi:predicted O-methyltransferase YrrM
MKEDRPMRLPAPFNSIRDLAYRQRKLRGALATLSGHSDALNPARMALRRAIRGPGLQERQAWAAIERQWDRMMQSSDTVEMPTGEKVSLATHAASASSRRPETDFFFQLARVLRPNAALELGTNVGMSGSYIAAGLKTNGIGHLWTLEGVKDLARAAIDNFKGAGLDQWATVVTGWFKDTLAPTLEHGPFTLVFIDGHHDGDATMNYYKQIKPRLTANSIIVLDDIRWSRGMQQAWKAISEDRDLRDAAEVMDWGIVAIW